jgi:hypothetical protein
MGISCENMYKVLKIQRIYDIINHKIGGFSMIEKSKDLRNQIQITCLDGLVPVDHLLRKIDKAVNFDRIYGIVEH